MKRIASLIVLAVVLSFIISLPALYAGEKVIDLKITDIVSKMDKRGHEYTRAIVEEAKELQGVKYTIGVPVMGFGAQNEELKTYRSGQNLKAVVSSREYQGRESYTLISCIK